MAKIMALDVGTRRIGVAVTDADRTFALPSEVVDASRCFEHVIERLTEEDFDTVVIGLPVDLKGREGAASKRSRSFKASLEAKLAEHNMDIAVELVDERLTTVMANHLLDEAGVRGQKRKEQVDAIAAQQILEAFLDSKR
ncbi:MAG: Holliday junction resolvase RuvX [bacterium]